MSLGDSFMRNWPQNQDDLKCPFCGHKQSTDSYWEDVRGYEVAETLHCQECEREIQVTRQLITWYEVTPSEEQMRSPHCERCQSDDFVTRCLYWDEHERNVYHHDDQREQGGTIEKVYHDPPIQEYAA